MNWQNADVALDNALRNKIYAQLLEAVAPYASLNGYPLDPADWQISDVSVRKEQVLMTIIHRLTRISFTSLVCCLDEPEILAVSTSSIHLGLLNPFLDGASKIESDLDAAGCWNIFATVFRAERNVTALRFRRHGQIHEVAVNAYGGFAIIDWQDNGPIEGYTELCRAGKWQKPVTPSLPFSARYLAHCWQRASTRPLGPDNSWEQWITGIFHELNGTDRDRLNTALVTLLGEADDVRALESYKIARRAFLARQAPLSGKILAS